MRAIKVLDCVFVVVIKSVLLNAAVDSEDRDGSELCDIEEHMISNEATLFQHDIVDFSLCGCAPDAGVRLRGQGNESKALLFKDNYFVAFDRRFSDRQIISTLQLIRIAFPGVPSNLKAAFSFSDGYVFVKDTRYFVFDREGRTVVNNGSLTDWFNFPTNFVSFASPLIDETQPNVTSIVVTLINGFFNCQFDEIQFNLACGLKQPVTDTAIELAEALGNIVVFVQLGDGYKLIYGTKKYCLTSSSGICYPACNSVIFNCPPVTWFEKYFIYFAFVGLMLVCGAAATYFCVITGQVVAKRSDEIEF